MDNIMGNRINKLRINSGMTMEDLAGKLGVGKSAVNKWEKGYVTNIKRETIQQMAAIFRCNPVWLMGYDEEPLVDYISPDEMILIERFRKSDSETQSVVKRLLAYESGIGGNQ